MPLRWPWALAALLAVPLLLFVRWWLNRRRRRVAIRVSSVALIRAAIPGRSRWRRRIPVALFLAGLLVLGIGAARPRASVAVPSSATSILLAIDVSSSMCSTDVAPNRLTAAREAARQFIKDQNDGTRVGLVAFSGIAGLLVRPTTDKKALYAALDTLRTSRGTAIGLGIMTAIDAISEYNPRVAPTGVDLEAAPDGLAGYEPDTIVVLTDGANTQGIDPVTAAEQAAARRLRVYTIGFGTTQPTAMVCTPDQIGGDAFRGDGPRYGGGGGGGGGRNFGRIDEPALQKVADTTGAQYFRAQDAKRLGEVLGKLPTEIVVQHQQVELTVWFVLGGALFVLAALGLSLWWNRSPALVTPPRAARPSAG
jgi:Ca-activated chloride channel family protein